MWIIAWVISHNINYYCSKLKICKLVRDTYVAKATQEPQSPWDLTGDTKPKYMIMIHKLYISDDTWG